MQTVHLSTIELKVTCDRLEETRQLAPAFYQFMQTLCDLQLGKSATIYGGN